MFEETLLKETLDRGERVRETLMFVLMSSLLCEVLESSGEDVEEIEYLSDSSWRPVRQDRSNKESAPPKRSKIRSQISILKILVR